MVINNFGARKVGGVAEAVSAVGACNLYLLPYSPDLNAIEQAFSSNLEALLRDVAVPTAEVLWTTIDQLVNRVSADKCRNYLANSGLEFS